MSGKTLVTWHGGMKNYAQLQGSKLFYIRYLSYMILLHYLITATPFQHNIPPIAHIQFLAVLAEVPNPIHRIVNPRKTFSNPILLWLFHQRSSTSYLEKQLLV